MYWRKYATQNSYHLSSISVAASESPRNSPTLSRSCWQNGSGATGASYDHKEKERERERESVCVCKMCVTCWDIEPCNLLWPAFHFRKESSLQMLVRIKWAGCLYHLAGNHQKANFITVSTGSPFQSYLTKIYYLLCIYI